MKLWIKLSLICTSILILVVGICCTLLILGAKSNIIELTKNAERNKQKNIVNSFSSMMDYYGAGRDNDSTKTALARYCFKLFAEDSTVLYADDLPLIMNVNVDPHALLSAENTDQKLYLGEALDMSIIIVGSSSIIQGVTYTIYTVTDITPVYNQIIAMVWQFVLIGTVAITIGTCLLLLILRFSMKPISQLRDTAQKISQGEYANRVEISSKDEVGDLAGSFNIMAQAVEKHISELEERSERQRLFIGGVAHEFKTPLTSILIHADTLINTTLPEENRQTSVRYIYEQSHLLERLTTKMLKLITVGAKVGLHDENIDNVLDSLQVCTADVLQSREQSIIFESSHLTYRMDHDLMLSLLINLVDNASKASEPGQTITVTARANEITVSDQGTGISPEDLQHITEPFYTADKSRSKKLSGNGIGLALAQEIAKAHGARLEFESEPGVGTTAKLQFLYDF